MRTSPPLERAPPLPGFVLGFGLGGLFDGILLHQLLQWHHLLSLVEGAAFRDLRVQVFADGVFHALMYAVASLGLWLLWRRRRQLVDANAGWRFLGMFVVGFGAWNVVDAIVFHWVLQIHHIRLAPDEQFASDVIWLVLLGLVPLLVGWRIWRRPPGGAGGGGRAAPTIAALVVIAAGGLSLAPRNEPMTAVLFRPDLSDAEVLGAISALDARLAWMDRTGDVVVVQLRRPADRWRLYLSGALLVGGAGPAGCLGWSRA